MDVFVFVPTVALGCYLILLCGIVSVKRTDLKRAFMATLSVYIFWVFGSVCMRLRILPSTAFWFYVSLLGIFLIPCFTLFFFERYISGKNCAYTYALQIFAVGFFVVNLFTDGWFIAPPEQMITENGIKFVYHIGIQSILPYVMYCVVMIYLGYILIQGVKQEKLGRLEFALLFSAKMIMLLGNILINVAPFKGFPIDMATGIPDALIMCYVFGGNQLVSRYRGVSRGGFRLFVLSATFSFMLCMEKPFEQYLTKALDERHEKNLTFIIVITFLAVFVLASFLVEWLAKRLFLKDEEVQMERMNEFRNISHHTLETEQIQELICTTAKKWMNLDWVGINTWIPRSNEFVMNKSLPNGSIPVLKEDSALVRYMRTSEGCVAWETIPEECRELYRNIYNGKNLVAIAIQSEEHLSAILFAKSVRKLTTSDKRYLELLAEISVDAIHNAEIYSQAYWESRTDELTGCSNRKRFYEILEKLQDLEPNRPVSFVIVKPDNFRVCNQLYGSTGGDLVLRKIAELMKDESCKEDTVFRYGSTEFLLLLCGYDTNQAREAAERIRIAVMNISGLLGQKQMMLTVSVGVSTTPEGERVSRKTVDNGILALYCAQQNGRNCTMCYREDNQNDKVFFKSIWYETYEPVFRALTAAVDAVDHSSFEHSQNVSYYATEMAKAIGMSEQEISVVKEAGILHDIGKAALPKDILVKPTILTEAEIKMVQGHVQHAISVLHFLDGMEDVIPMISAHHENFDGTGYPRGISGKEIPIGARIIRIADSFDAMISLRSYKKQLPVHEAIKELVNGQGKQYDPELVLLFVKLVEEGTIRVRKNS